MGKFEVKKIPYNLTIWVSEMLKGTLRHQKSNDVRSLLTSHLPTHIIKKLFYLLWGKYFIYS